MVKIVCVVLTFVSLGYAARDENETVACCFENNFIITPNNLCWNPNTNITSPNRLKCNSTLSISRFTVADNKVKIPISELHSEIIDPALACSGERINKNLSKTKPIALLCYEEAALEEEERNALSYCMIVSIVFLGLTAIVYSSFKELRDLFGKSIINFCISLAIGEAILSIINLMPYSDMTACAIRGFLTYFFLIAAFFWTNSISIQVLRDTRRPSISVDYGWSEFRWYALYSWGAPALLTIIMAIVNYHPGDHDRPGIGLNNCWFIHNQQWYYMYSVMSILLIVNIGIFIYVATMVWRYKFNSSHVQAMKFKLSMTFRLMVVMGLPWIFEMVTATFESGSIIGDILDIFNALQGLFVFLVLVVLRKRVIKVMRKHGWLVCCAGLIDKHLAAGDDAEDNVIQHTDIPMSEDHRSNGNNRNIHS